MSINLTEDCEFTFSNCNSGHIRWHVQFLLSFTQGKGARGNRSDFSSFLLSQDPPEATVSTVLEIPQSLRSLLGEVDRRPWERKTAEIRTSHPSTCGTTGVHLRGILHSALLTLDLTVILLTHKLLVEVNMTSWE